MNILILEPYYTGSHASWADGYVRHSVHKVEILAMEGRYWKWRMHGGAVTLARKFIESDLAPDLILATDMLDLTTFLSLTRTRTASIPAVLYFHENQLSYPWSPGDRDVAKNRDGHYGFINYSSALAADAVFFNSRYHFGSFIDEAGRFLQRFPDYNERESINEIISKSAVLPLGLDLSRLEAEKPDTKDEGREIPLILWNHRWEYDKNPGDFFEALYILADRGIDFEVAVAGENFRKRPEEFEEAKRRLEGRIVQYGYVCEFSGYASWLWKADILPVTSNQDFFGASVVEGIFCDCFPLLPKRLAYPEHIPGNMEHLLLYDEFDDLVDRLEWALKNIDTIRGMRFGHLAAKYRWENMAPIYDEIMAGIVKD